jgi:hypothetical protein
MVICQRLIDSKPKVVFNEALAGGVGKAHIDESMIYQLGLVSEASLTTRRRLEKSIGYIRLGLLDFMQA